MKTEAELRTYLFLLGFTEDEIQGKGKDAQYTWKVSNKDIWAGVVNWHHYKDRNNPLYRWKLHDSDTFHIFHTLPRFIASLEHYFNNEENNDYNRN